MYCKIEDLITIAEGNDFWTAWTTNSTSYDRVLPIDVRSYFILNHGQATTFVIVGVSQKYQRDKVEMYEYVYLCFLHNFESQYVLALIGIAPS